MTLVALVTLLAFVGGTAGAASHSDAPLIKQDPQANLTDVYAFVGTKYNNPREKVLNVIVHVRPFSEPGDGVIYDRFADDARYSIHITDPATGADRDPLRLQVLERESAVGARPEEPEHDPVVRARRPSSGRSTTSATPGRTSRRPTTSPRW